MSKIEQEKGILKREGEKELGKSWLSYFNVLI